MAGTQQKHTQQIFSEPHCQTRAGALVVSNILLLTKISKYVDHATAASIRQTNKKWNVIFSEAMKRTAHMVYLSHRPCTSTTSPEGRTSISDYCQSMCKSIIIPFTSYTIHLSSCLSEQAWDEFSTKVGPSITAIRLSQCGQNTFPTSLIRQALFKQMVNVVELSLYLTLNTSSALQFDIKQHRSRLGTLSSLKHLTVDLADSQEHGDLCVDIIVCSPNLLEITMISAFGTDVVLSALLVYGAASLRSITTCTHLTAEHFQQLITMSKRNERNLELERIHVAHGSARFATSLFYHFLQYQAKTLLQLGICCESKPEPPDYYDPEAHAAQTFQLKMPKLPRLSVLNVEASSDTDGASLVVDTDEDNFFDTTPNLMRLMGGNLEIYLHHRNLRELCWTSVVTYEECCHLSYLFPSVRILMLNIRGIEVFPKIWSSWLSLKKLRIYIDSTYYLQHYEEVGLPYTLNEVVTGIDLSKFELSNNGEHLTGKEIGKLVDAKCRPGICDLNILEEFILEFPGGSLEKDQLTVSRNVAIKYPSSKLKVFVLL